MGWRSPVLVLATCLLAGGLPFGCGDKPAGAAPTKPAPLPDEAAARATFFAYLADAPTKEESRWPRDLQTDIKRFGASTWLIYAHFSPKSQPEPLAKYIADAEGVREATLQNLVYAHAHELPPAADEAGLRRFIDSIVNLDSTSGSSEIPPATLISSTKDIPGYDKVIRGMEGVPIGGPLDADFAGVVRPPWKVEGPRPGWLTYVVYTYRRVGGVVSRYKFEFGDQSLATHAKVRQWQIYTVTRLELGNGAGDFAMLD